MAISQNAIAMCIDQTDQILYALFAQRICTGQLADRRSCLALLIQFDLLILRQLSPEAS